MPVINKESLTTRLERLHTGYPAFREFPGCAIKTFANTRMSEYFSGFPTEKKRLTEILCMGDIDMIPYKVIASKIYELKDSPLYEEDADEAALLLAAPIRYFYKNRKARNEKSN